MLGAGRTSGYGDPVTTHEHAFRGVRPGGTVEMATATPEEGADQQVPAPSAEAVGRSRGLGVGLMVLIVFAATVLTAVADTLINGSITYLTGVVFVVVSVIAAAAVGYADLSTAVITPPLAYFAAIVVAAQPDLWEGSTTNLLIREVAMIVAGLAFSAPWIFAGTGAALFVVTVRRWILRR